MRNNLPGTIAPFPDLHTAIDFNKKIEFLNTGMRPIAPFNLGTGQFHSISSGEYDLRYPDKKYSQKNAWVEVVFGKEWKPTASNN